MSFSIAYETTERISPLLQREICDAAETLVHAYDWLHCDPPSFEDSEGFMVGTSEICFTADPPDVATSSRDQMPDGKVTDLLDCLCALSSKFGIDFELNHDYGLLGFIRHGICDDDVRTQFGALGEIPDGLDLDEDDFDLDDE